MKYSRSLFALIFLVTAAGFLLEWWPIAVAGVAAMGFVGRGYFAPLLGLLLDLAYGAPAGFIAPLFFPFTILGLLIVVGRYIALRYFMNRASRDRI
ncbi:MAG: hypothetical protein Q8P58_00655 [Candidatus Adlerbacteria bacterium]|nr:hypothetical protein [Candidatus Adlerbacteria bacterium]